MARYTYIQNSFSSGEVSEKLAFRNDIKEFQTGLTEMTNFIPGRAGGSTFRPGFRKDSNVDFTTKGRVMTIPFVFDESDIHYVEVDLAHITAPVKIFTLGLGYGTVNITPEALTDLNSITDPQGFSIVQTNNILIMSHNSGNIPPILITRDISSPSTKAALLFGVSTFFNTTYHLMKDHEYNPVYRIPSSDPNKSITTITPSGTDAALVLTASTGIFSADHVGSYFMLDDQSGTPRNLKVEITSYTSSTVIGGVVRAGAVASFTMAATDYWYEAAWSVYRGFPKSVTIVESRLIFGGNKDYPNTLWGSSLFVYFHFDRFLHRRDSSSGVYERSTTESSNPWEFTIASTHADPIMWLGSTNVLVVGTLSQEYIVSGGDSVVSANNIAVVKQTAHGGSPVQPAVADNSLYFISRDGRSIIEFTYSSENGSFVSRNISTLSEDILHKYSTDRRTRIIKITWQESASTLWAMTNTGLLLGLTLNRSSGINAFHSHPISGTTIQDMMVLPNSEFTFDDLYLLADHTAFTTGSTLPLIKQVDVFEHTDLFNASSYEEDEAIYLDYGEKITVAAGAYAYTAANGTLLTVLGDDGVIYTDVAVTSNSFTLSGTPTDVYAGIPYEGTLKTLRLEIGPNQNLNSQGDIIRIDKATIKVYKTFAGQYGSADTDLYDFEIENDESFTGLQQVDLPQSPDVDNRVIVAANKPLPLTVIGIVFRGQNHS